MLLMADEEQHGGPSEVRVERHILVGALDAAFVEFQIVPLAKERQWVYRGLVMRSEPKAFPGDPGPSFEHTTSQSGSNQED